MTNENSNLDKPFGLMDGATGEFQRIHQDVNRQRKITVDESLPLADRLEAYEDIIDSEVGDTALIRARNIERETRSAPDLFEIPRGEIPPAPRKTALPLPRPWTHCVAGSTPSRWPPAATSAWHRRWPPPWRHPLRHLYTGKLPYPPDAGDGGAAAEIVSNTGRL